MSELPQIAKDGVVEEVTGTIPDVSDSLNDKNRSISSVSQAISVIDRIIKDWDEGIKRSAKITAKLNGERPYNQTKLKNAAKDWKTNISTGFLATECARVIPRLFMPIKTAKYLVAATLPPNWPDGQRKTEAFREVITEKIRSWSKFNFYVRGLAREVGIYGFAFNSFFDEYDPWPTLLRMDKGFVPQGTEILEEPEFFVAKYDYKPSELLSLLKTSVDAGRSEWNKANVIEAINSATVVPVDGESHNARTYEELIRQSTNGWNYVKGVNTIQTYHLFAKETSGKVSHYVLLCNPLSNEDGKDSRLLYENLDQFDSMFDAVNIMVFDFGDGTVHGAWGAGQILYDLAAQVEKIRCDAMDSLRNSNKIKANVQQGASVNDVKLVVNDTMMIVSGAQFAGNTAAIGQDVQGYELLDQKLSQIAQQKIGAFVPPIPLQPSDVKAAQVNAAMAQERELQESLLENWLIQCAYWFSNMAKRLTNFDSPHPDAIDVINTLTNERNLTPEDIFLLANSSVQSVMDFTEYKTQQRAMFASTVKGDPLFNQAVVARTMAAGAGDSRFVAEICIPEGDQSQMLTAQRQQIVENTALLTGQSVPVVPQDDDWTHMQAMRQGLVQAVDAGQVEIARVGLDHFAAHYAQGVEKKGIPKDQINETKSFIAAIEERINVLQEQRQIQQAAQQAEQQAIEQAQRILQAEAGIA